MLRIRKSSQFAVLLASLAVSTVALASSIQTDYDHRADFTQYKTYSWGDIKVQSAADTDHIKDAVNQDLQSKGWRLLPSGGKTTIFVTGQITSEQQLETRYTGTGPAWGGVWNWGGWDWGNTGGFVAAVNYKTGNLVFDIFDSNTRALLFRGIAEQEVRKNAEKNTKQLDKNLDKILVKFPPR